MTTNGSRTTNADEDYGFDVAGFIHLRQVLTAAEIEACTSAIDTVGQNEGLLEWSSPSCEPFRALQEHPVLQNYLERLCGAGFVTEAPPVLVADNAGDKVPLDAGDPERNRRLRYVNYADTRTSFGVRIIWALAPTPAAGGVGGRSPPQLYFQNKCCNNFLSF